MQRRTLLLCLLVLGLIAGACVSGTQQTNNGRAEKKGSTEQVKIGFSMDTLKEERWQRDKDLVEKRAKEIGAEVERPGGKQQRQRTDQAVLRTC